MTRALLEILVCSTVAALATAAGLAIALLT